MGISTPILAVFIGIAYILLNKLILGRNKRKVSKTVGKKIYIWGMVIIGLIGIGSILFVLDVLNNNVMKWFWVFFIILLLGFQSIMEWKFLKGSKEYLVSIIVLILGLIYIYTFIF